MVFIRFPFQCDLKVLDYGNSSTDMGRIKHDIESYLGTDQFTLLCNGKSLHDVDVISGDSNVQVTFSLPGGKGGFGSMLRAIGAQIEKTTNREACRDLSGRRLRDINEEQRLKKWIAKEAEREAEKVRRRKERIERLKHKPAHKFFDFEYEKEISELPAKVNEALSEGLQKAKQPAKRPLEKPVKPIKKTWLADDFPISSSDSELEETDSATGSSPSKKPKVAQTVSSSCVSDISESSQSLPGTSKDSFAFDESSASCDSKIASTGRNSEESSTVSDDVHMQDVVTTSSNNIELGKHDEDTNASSISDSKITDSTESTMIVSGKDAIPVSDVKVSEPVESETENAVKDVMEVEKSSEKDVVIQPNTDSNSKKVTEEKDDSPIDLLDFQSVSELEALGLDRLKFALMARGLKCGGTLSDRAQRLWKVRDLKPHEYPANLLAKGKK